MSYQTYRGFCADTKKYCKGYITPVSLLLHLIIVSEYCSL